MRRGGPLAIVLLTVPPLLGALPGERCLPCHAEQVTAFRKTGMGRSAMERPEVFSGSLFHRLSNRHYTVAGGAMRRHQVTPAGEAVNVVEKEVHFSIGSGNHAITYLNRTPAGRLLELPLSWYAKLGAYAMSPGYDQPDHFDFRREVSDACLFCHSNGPRIEPIGCERCHGDTAGHLKRPGKGTILNPARLAADRQREICFQCHLETSSRAFPDSMRRPGRSAFSFVPGEALGAYKLYFDRVGGDAFEINHSAYGMLKSTCFNKSGGRMTCTTCHDPHSAAVKPRVCSGCHAPAHVKVQERECIGCHMPKRTPSDAIHTVMTDHQIRRKPEFQSPTREERTPYTGPLVNFYTMADPLTLAVMNVRAPSAEAADTYRRFLRANPGHAPSLAALGNMLIRLNQLGEAIAVLKRALEADPGQVEVLNNLAVAMARKDGAAAALPVLEKARREHPDHAATWVNLGNAYEALDRASDALAAYTEAVRLQPDSSEARARRQRLLQAR